MRLSLVFYDRGVVETDTSTWEMIDSGGEADIYEALIAGRKYVVKVFTQKQTELAKPVERVAEMLSRLVRLRHRCGGLPQSLLARGFPIAVGAHQDSAVLVFRYIEEFRTLADIANSFEELRAYLAENNLSARISMARDVLKALACLDLADVVHVDVTTANTAYGVIDGSRWVYLFDLETAAIMGSEDYALAVIPARDAHYMPVDSLSLAGIELRAPEPSDLPLPIIPSRLSVEYLSWVLWTPVWYGFQLVSFTFTGMGPFQGLPAATMDYWLDIVEHEKERGYEPVWPPRAMHELGVLEANEYRELSNMWSSLGRDIVRGMYQVFVIDVAEKKRVPSISLPSVVGIR